MDESEWPCFPASLLEAPAEEWGRLPGDGRGWEQPTEEAAQQQSDEEAASANLLADLEEAFAGARGDVDRAKALDTMQTFLSVRRVRLLEDLMLLDMSLGGSGGTEEEKKQWDAGIRDIECSSSSSSSINNNPTTVADYSGEDAVKGLGVLLREGGVEEEGLRAAAEESTDAFFTAWAEKFGRLFVPLGKGSEQGGGGEGDGGADGGGGGGGARKDDREIQAARDVERDTLCVNGVLVVGSEGYSAVVGRVKRELGRVADPVAGPDGAPPLIQGGGAGGGGGGGRGGVGGAGRRGGGGGDGPSRFSSSSSSSSLQRKFGESRPLRPPRQLENFSKLVLKAANRTESGGLSFDAIHRVMVLCPAACDGSVLVVPDSSKAEPLGITISAEGFTEKGNTPFGPLESVGSTALAGGLHAFGIVARIEAVTVYSLYSADMEHVHLKIRAIFRSMLRLALSPVCNATCEAFSDVGYRGEQGSVEIVVVEGSHASGH